MPHCTSLAALWRKGNLVASVSIAAAALVVPAAGRQLQSPWFTEVAGQRPALPKAGWSGQ